MPLRDISKLAIFSGVPAFERPLHVGAPNLGDRSRLLQRINELLDRNWLTNDGPLLQEFEQRICQLTGVKHCVCVCNATVGLEILARALCLSGEVILPSFTFVATAHALRWLGITPVFCDVDPATHNLDPFEVEKLIGPRTSAILGVHVWGRACDVDALIDLARRRGLKLLFDAAHAFACSHQGRMIGSFGNAEIFSFHATKFVNSFEGGAIVTNDKELADRLRLMRNFGFADVDMVNCVGTNGKMSEASAAMGLTSLESIGNFVELNRRNFHLYEEYLGGLPGILLVRYDKNETCNYQYVVLEIDEAISGVSRDTLNEILWAENVLARRYFYPGCHRMEPYCTENPDAGLRLAHTEKLASRVLCLPTGSAIGPHEIEGICEIIRVAMDHTSKIEHERSRLVNRRMTG